MLIVGTYRYLVANLGMVMRWVAYLVGFGGGRETAIAMLEQCARYESEARTEARVGLVLVYNQEKRYGDAMQLLKMLREEFPGNRLLWLESGATELRAGRAAAALELLDAGLARYDADTRPKAFGEAALWRCKRGTALVALGRRDAAEADLRASLAAEAREWVHGRAHTELGKLADLAGNRALAMSEYRKAADLGRLDNDPMGVTDAERWLAAPYTGTDAAIRRQ
jgi:tetratricopeptide (TPR) repeat protein